GVSTKTYFLTVSPKSWAIGKTVRMTVTSTSSFSLGAYDTVMAPGLPFLSNPATVMSCIFANEAGSSNPNTDISVMTGQALQIFSTGTWSYNGGGTFVTGAGSGACSVSCPIPSAPRGALIARGYNIPWFVVGLSTVIVPSGSDTLYLAMNDDNYNDNIGMMMYNKSAIASTKTWTGAACGGVSCNEASNPDNWQGGVLPAYGDNVVFGASGVKDCFWNMNITVNSLSLEPGYTGRVSMLNAPGMSVNRLEISDFLRIRGGTLDLTGHIVAASSISVSGGTLDLGGGFGELEVGEGGLHIFGSGTLSFTGSSNVTMSPLDASPYPVAITGGTVTVNGTGRLNINGSAGVTVSTAAGVPSLTFNRVGVYSTPSGAAALTVNAGAGVFTFSDWLFDATVSKNVDGSLLGGSALVRMNNAVGDRMGTPHEFSDPGNRVVWNPDGGGTASISGSLSYSGGYIGDYLVFVTTDQYRHSFVAKSSFSEISASYSFAGLKAPATYYVWATKDSDSDNDYSPVVPEPVGTAAPIYVSAGGSPVLNLTLQDMGGISGGVDSTATGQAGNVIMELHAQPVSESSLVATVKMGPFENHIFETAGSPGVYTVLVYIDANSNGRLDAAFESSGTLTDVTLNPGDTVYGLDVVLSPGATEPGGAVSITTAAFLSGGQIGRSGSMLLMKLGLVSNGGAGILRSLQFDSLGTAKADKFRVTLYMDDGNGVFDGSLTSPAQSYTDPMLGDSYFSAVSSQAVVWFTNDVSLND
ncbi:MAG TPA: hypothetical protein PL037_06100, partial [Elusimicrobiales bacterium]|nr:hypothetical protein [Elusimicrobiales bacterium]